MERWNFFFDLDSDISKRTTNERMWNFISDANELVQASKHFIDLDILFEWRLAKDIRFFSGRAD